MSMDDEEEPYIGIFYPMLNPKFDDDMVEKILSPLSYLKEFESKWVLEVDLPLVNKKDIKVSLDSGNVITVEAKLSEAYIDTKHDVKHEFQYFKKRVSLPGKIDGKKITVNFKNGRLIITIPKVFGGNEVQVE